MNLQPQKQAEHNRLINQYRREARTLWELASPYRQMRYAEARIKGKTPEQSIQIVRPQHH